MRFDNILAVDYGRLQMPSNNLYKDSLEDILVIYFY